MLIKILIFFSTFFYLQYFFVVAEDEAKSLQILNIDISGKCSGNYQPSFNTFHGHCVPYEDCPSAVIGWDRFKIKPLSCYLSENTNFVCCPDNKVATEAPLDQLNEEPDKHKEKNIDEKPILKDEHFELVHKVERINNASIETNSSTKIQTPQVYDSSENAIEESLTKINENVETASAGEFPFICRLGWKRSHSHSHSHRRRHRQSHHRHRRHHYHHAELDFKCSCVLIAQKYVLTAAHCARINGESPSYASIGGRYSVDNNTELIKIKRILRHPDHKRTHLDDKDIALIKLKHKSRHTPATLPTQEHQPLPTNLLALAYGKFKTDAEQDPYKLLKVRINTLRSENTNMSAEISTKDIRSTEQTLYDASTNSGGTTCPPGNFGAPIMQLTFSAAQEKVSYVYGIAVDEAENICGSNNTFAYARISNEHIRWLHKYSIY